VFRRVGGDLDQPYDEDIISNRFFVWQCGNIFVKIEVTVSSYGDSQPTRWDFVEPKEKTITVYE
jgi:hypothetical protein